MEEFPSQLIDYGKHFTIHKRFKDREEFIEEVKQIGEQQNIFVIICRSTKADGSGSGKVWIGCERFGGYRPQQNRKTDVVPRNRTGTLVVVPLC